MISTMLRISWLGLKRDWVALGLTFVLPVLFFTIFAGIFTQMGTPGDSEGGMDIIGVDVDGSEISASLLTALGRQEGLNVHTTLKGADGTETAYTAATAEQAVRSGDYPVAVVVPKGFGDAFGRYGQGPASEVKLVYDPSNAIARFSVVGLLQSAAMQASPTVMMDRGMSYLDIYGGGLTEQQKMAVDSARGLMSQNNDPNDGSGMNGVIAVKEVNVRAAEDSTEKEAEPSLVPYYAAGIGVMFLLFSMTGAAGSILEEEESGSLERIIFATGGMGGLLAGKWIFFTITGFLQLTLMFTWGWVVFGLDLFTANHLVGFVAMALVTACAASAFAILMATICTTRAQLSGVSTILILLMSALGGSMVPRMLMPKAMQELGKFTFNGQALDGFLKVFWYEQAGAGPLETVLNIAPQMAILTVMTVIFMIAARTLSKRWETV